ncbi:hypothetical protein ILUMI_22034 [Ignelater luminosus]|uniref:Uncharacterized protein n=1 Tax=Ignelater luminosus TaxID=2038154 RepID=A0A8K0FXL0_IGNLU|nr:hypothetical protein ILUMI_22034 [Ignelater luminosus]
MGLLVDVPKAGFGRTNDGNSSRRFLFNRNLSAEITGVDSHLIHRLKARKTTKPFLKESLEMLLSTKPPQSMVDVSDKEESIIETEESSDEEP